MGQQMYLTCPVLMVVALSGCSSGALFVTKTSVAIADIDTAPASISVAYDRTEGYIAPRNDNGDVPPVLAHIQSDGLIVSPEITQIYATGTAAEQLAGYTSGNNSTCETCSSQDKNKYPVSFITSTTIGIKMGFLPDTAIPNEFTLGLKRKEASIIPDLAKDTKGTYHYPSLLASLKSNVTKSRNAHDGICQFFATGTAATKLAADGKITLTPSKENTCGPDDVSILKGEYKSTLDKQTVLTLEITNCYLALNDQQKYSAWENAANLTLLASISNDNSDVLINNNKTQLNELRNTAKPTPTPDTEEGIVSAKIKADRIYLGQLQNNISGTLSNNQLGGNRHREINLQSHRDFVCSKM